MDLFPSTAPSKIIKVEALPGISDYDIVAIEADISPKRRNQKPSKKTDIAKRYGMSLKRKLMS